MRKPFPQAGDGIITTQLTVSHVPTGIPGIVRSRNTRGIHALTDNDPSTNSNDLVGVEADVRVRSIVYPNRKVSVRKTLWVGEYRQETFLEHLTRPTGFGKMHWFFFYAIQALFIGATIAEPQNWWITGIAFLVVNGVLVFGSYMNYVRKWV